MEPWMALAWLWLMATVISLVSGVVMALVCWSVGASLSELRFHVGPPLLSFRIRGVKWSFGFLNFGASVTFEPLGIRRDGTDNNSFLQLPLFLRLIVHTSTIAGMLLLAVACLSPARGLAAFTSGFEQVVNVLLAQQRVVAFFALLRTEGFWPALGVLSAKLAALNLLPLPPLTGYMMLREFWRGSSGPGRGTRASRPGAWCWCSCSSWDGATASTRASSIRTRSSPGSAPCSVRPDSSSGPPPSPDPLVRST
ncbi:hypothetical protein F0U59_41565 [Archangium gephyra]|nr:hypothetical protein F0U59_41565 [Archangium gephyra]